MRSRICDMSSTSPAMSRMVSFAGFACVWFIRASLLCLCTLPSVYGIPRGSDYGSSQPFIVAPTLRGIYPSVGPKEGGASLTITGSGFRRSTGLKVTFSTKHPKLEVDTVAATFVDSSTIVVTSPHRESAHVAHVSVTNDGSTYSALPTVTNGGPGSYLEYTYIGDAPWGSWALDNHTLSGHGTSMVTVTRNGQMVDGQVEGSAFYSSGNIYCASGPARRRKFSHFSDVEFINSGAATLDSDRTLVVDPHVSDSFDYFVSNDFTYEILTVSDSGVMRWKWRKWALGMFPSGSFSDLKPFSTVSEELEYGVSIRFMSTSGKQDGDLWRFHALTEIPSVVKGSFVSEDAIVCPMSPVDPSMIDLDPGTVGLQQEVKISMRGENCFSEVTFIDSEMRRTVTGDPINLSLTTDELMFTDDIKIHVEGYFSGPEDYTFEVRMTSSDAFQWRKYRTGDSVCKTSTTGPWCAFRGTGTLSESHATLLEHGVFIKFATLEGKKTGDKWIFDAYTFWSTTYSPVQFTGNVNASPDDALLYVQGSFIGDIDTTFEIEVMADNSKFRWRSFPSRNSGTVATWSEDNFIGTNIIEIENGVILYWLTLEGKSHGDKWSFSAYTGHVITWMSASYVGDAVPADDNIDGDVRLPTVSGIYLGESTARIRLEIGGDCSTSCSQFRWIKEYPIVRNPYEPLEWQGGRFSPYLNMISLDQKLTDGISVTWGPTSGYKHGNTYSFDLVPMPTSILPVRPTPTPAFHPFGMGSTFHDGSGDAPARNSVLTVEFVSTSAFKWRKDTGSYSSPVTVVTDQPITLGYGVNLTFTSATGYTSGLRYMIPLRSHIPHVTNVSSAHSGSRVASFVSQPVAALSNYANLPNKGSLLSDVRPWSKNAGNHSIFAFPAAGSSSGGASAVSNGGGDSQRGIGLSNIIHAVATQGFPVASYPTTYIKIVGEADISEVLGVFADELFISGTYSGSSSYVYQLEPHGSTSLFRWRKYPLGLSDANATSWTAGLAISVSSATLVDSGLSVKFQSASYTVSVANRWTFTADRGHTFVYRDAGRASWSAENRITGQPQELSSGISVQFSHLSGYSTGDQFVISNRTIDSYGVYTGESDIEYTVEILDRKGFDPPTFHRSTSGSTTGSQAKMIVTGGYTGRSTFTYEVKIVSASSSAVSQFTWRKYLLGYGAGGGPFSLYARDLSLSPVALDEGVFVSWASISGHTVGDIWRFTAHAGDTFRWKEQDGLWSLPQMISNVGLVERDINNVGSKEVNIDIHATGDYEGTADATIVIEVLAGGATFRWKKHAYLPLAGSFNSTGTTGPYCCGTEDVMYDSQSMEGVRLGSWSPQINMMSTVPIYLDEGVYVYFATTFGYSHGDMYYIPVKQSRHHRLSHGVNLAFGSMSGYSPGDKWSLTATSGVPARGPLDGRTQIVVKGSGFLPTSSLRCRLTDPRTLHTTVLPARYVSSEEVQCITVAHPPDMITDPVFHGVGESTIFTHGVYTGTQTLVFTISLTSATTFKWRADPMENSDSRNGDWSDPMEISAGNVVLLDQGVSVRFLAETEYSAGDEWKVTAYSVDHQFTLDRHEVQLGTVRPGVMKYVSVSNDGGTSWSVDKHGMTRFLYSDIHVSASGDDVTGDGTSALPYRTIQRAIHASLSSAYVRQSSFNDAAHDVNHDDVIVSPGRYTGAGNTGLFTLGKMVSITAARSGEVVIDCSLHASSDVYFGEALQASGGSGRVNLVGINVEKCA